MQGLRGRAARSHNAAAHPTSLVTSPGLCPPTSLTSSACVMASILSRCFSTISTVRL